MNKTIIIADLGLLNKKRKKKKYFIELARHRRRAECIKIKNKLRRGYNCGKHFTTHHELRSGKTHRWIDICFLSKKDPSIFYNAALISSAMDLYEKIEKAADEAHDTLFPDFDYELEFIDLGELSQIVFPQELKERKQWLNQKKLELIKGELPPIFEKAKLHYDSCYGIGLQATLKQEALTIEDIDAFIEEFWANGEQEYCSDTPIQISQPCIDDLIQRAEKGQF